MDKYILPGILFAIAVFAICWRISRTNAKIKLYTTKNKELEDRAKRLSQLESRNVSKENELKKQEALLIRERQALAVREKRLMQEVEKQATAHLRDMLSSTSVYPYFSGTAVFDEVTRINPVDANQRLLTAQSEHAKIYLPLFLSADIQGHNGEIYHVTLNKCTCRDFQFRKKPCKHMYRLALEVGILLMIPRTDIDNAFTRLAQRSLDLSEFEKKKEQAVKRLHERELRLSNREKEFDKLTSETAQTYPWLAKEIADYYYLQDMRISRYLQEKPHPAVEEAKRASTLAKEKRELRAQLKQAEYQLNYYETVFPWLEEFKTLPPQVAANYAANEDSDYNSLYAWLSDETYDNLSSIEKNQLLLDRWLKHPRTDFEAGLDYERYVKYRFEQDGFQVDNPGALLRFEDMGRDLIAEKNGIILAIQCKRWSQKKTIHEKHIFQLYGSAVKMSLDYKKPVDSLFITTTTLSDTAKECADYLKVSYKENYPLEPYPMIKCNISREGKKIYHLPFDQQYDRVVIKPELGEFYAWTVQEAEDAGFRRAYRWNGSKGQ